jgi:hypothetical protein
MTIFGISILDLYGISFLASFYTEFITVLGNIINYLTNTHFYTTLFGLSNYKADIIEKSGGNIKVVYWFKPEINQKENQLDENNSNKYYIIAGMFVLSCLVWYYYGDTLNPMVTSGFNKIKNVIRRPDPDNNWENEPNNIWSESCQNIINKVKSIFRRSSDNNTPPENNTNNIELINNQASTSKGKTIDFNNLSLSEIHSRGFLEHQTTGSTPNHINIINEISTFIDYNERSAFPKTAAQITLYNIIRARLLKLSQVNENLYNNLIQDDIINNKIEKFLNLEDEILRDDLLSPKYNEVQLNTIQEQEVWSDKANSPSSQDKVLLPLKIEQTLETQPVKNKSLLEEFIQEVWKDEEPIIIEENNVVNTQTVNTQPEIKIEADNSPNSSLEHYFPEQKDKSIEVNKTEEFIQGSSKDISINENNIKPKFNNIFDAIKARRDDTNVITTPKITQVGLQPTIDKNVSSTLLLNKPSISNLFDDTNNLFDDLDDIDINTSFILVLGKCFKILEFLSSNLNLISLSLLE